MKIQEFITVGGDGYFYTCGYFTANKWIGGSSVALARSRDKEIGKDSELLIFNYKSGDMKVVTDNLNSWLDYAVFESKVYCLCGTNICVYDNETGSIEIIYDFGALPLGSPHLTADGKYMSLFSYAPEEGMQAYRFDIKARQLEHIFSHSFAEPRPIANHLMISPTDKNVFFFAHEGDTRFVSDRLWIYDAKSRKARNIAEQRTDKSGFLADCFGHEMWSHDGGGLYFVKYTLSRSEPKGICYVSLDSGIHSVLYSKFAYWHVSISNDGTFIAADTSDEPGICSVVLIDTDSKEETVIERISSRKTHPNHPHPSVSPDNCALMYNFKTDADTDGVRIALLEK
jgi:Tol biopolymer transport system component